MSDNGNLDAPRPAQNQQRPPVMPLIIGSVLQRTFSILFRNIVPLGGVMLLASLPSLLIFFFLADQFGGANATQPTGGLFTLFGGFFIMQWVLYAWSMAGVTYGAFEASEGRRPSFAACIAAGIARLLPMIGIFLIYVLLMLLLGGVSVGVMMLATPFVGVPLVFVAFAYLATIFLVTVAATVIDRPGVLASFGRSIDYTRGNRWRVLGLLVILAVISIAASFIWTFVFSFAGVAVTEPTAIIFALIPQLAFSAVMTAAWVVMATVVYYDLRSARGGDMEQTAAVFD